MSVRSDLQARLREQEKSLSNHKKRLQELKVIISNLSNCSGNGMSEVNEKIVATHNELQWAASSRYIQCFDALKSSKDNGSSDSNIDGAMSSLNAEHRVVESKIATIESTIRTLRRRIAEAIEEERKIQ